MWQETVKLTCYITHGEENMRASAALHSKLLLVECLGVDVTFCCETLKSTSAKSKDGRLRLLLKPCQGLNTADGWGPEAGWRSEVPSSSGPGSISRLLVQYSIEYSPQRPRWQ